MSEENPSRPESPDEAEGEGLPHPSEAPPPGSAEADDAPPGEAIPAPAEAPAAPNETEAAAEDETTPEDELDQPWIELAAPYLDRLGNHLKKQGVKNHSVSVPIGSARLLLTPLEQQLVVSHFETNAGVELDHLSQLIRDGVGMQVCLLAAAREYTKAEAQARGPLRQRLVDSVKATNYLAFAMHRQANALSNSGEFDRARQCGEYRKNLLDAADRASEIVGGDPSTMDLPSGAIGAGRRRLQAIKDEEERSARERARARAREAARQAALARKRRNRIIAAVASVVALVLSLAWAWQQRPVELEHFSINDFSRVPGAQTIVHRDPKLLVIVESTTWNRLSQAQRKAAVLEAARVVETVGYEEVEFRTEGAAGLAWWRKGKGVEIPSR